MGQNNSRQSETINWNQIKTNDMSSTIPNLNGISREAQELISRLNLPEVSETNSEFNINNVLNINNSQNLNKNNKELLTENGDDNSSPFISSEMYNYIVNKYNNKTSNSNMMVGGGANDNMGDDSSTSATSSSLSSDALKSSPSETDETPKKVEHKNKDKKKEHKKEEHKKEVSEEEEEEASEEHVGWKGKKGKAAKGKTKGKAKSNYTGSEYLSYVSSSAHTGGSLTESVANENNYTISTVRTSDINMISE